MIGRWYDRILIWTRFLWQVSRIELSLIPMHPDRLGGLGFLSNIAYAFTPLAVAHGALVPGPIANRMFYLSRRVAVRLQRETAFIVLFVMALVFGPFLVFAAPPASAKRTGLREYGPFAERYVREFDMKWLRGGAPRPTSRWSEAVTSSRWPISATASKWSRPCASRK
jgi:hypothetical protein